MTPPDALFKALAGGSVDFILVGGVAASLHGSSRLTEDIDVVYARTRDNIERLVTALRPHRPYLRGAPAGLPFQWDVDAVEHGLNFTLTTDLGDLDLLGEIAGGGTYAGLIEDSIVVELFGIECRCLGLRRLIEVKRAAGRPKDLEAIAELEVILEERGEG